MVLEDGANLLHLGPLLGHTLECQSTPKALQTRVTDKQRRDHAEVVVNDVVCENNLPIEAVGGREKDALRPCGRPPTMVSRQENDRLELVCIPAASDTHTYDAFWADVRGDEAAVVRTRRRRPLPDAFEAVDEIDFDLNALRVAEVLDGAHNVSVDRQSENPPHLPGNAPIPPDASLADRALRIVDSLEAQTERRHDGIIVVADAHRLHDLDSLLASDQRRFAATKDDVSLNRRRHRWVAFVAAPRDNLQVGVEDARRVQQSLAAESGFGRPAIRPAGLSGGLNAAGPAPRDAVVVVVVVVVAVVVVVVVVAVALLETTNGMRPHRAHQRAVNDSSIGSDAPRGRVRREPLERDDSKRSIDPLREVNGLANESRIVTGAHVDVDPHAECPGHGVQQRGIISKLGRTSSQHTIAKRVQVGTRHPERLAEILLADLIKHSGDEIAQLSFGLLSSECTAPSPARPSSRIGTSIPAATVVSPGRPRERMEHAESVGCLPYGHQVAAVQPGRVRCMLHCTKGKSRC